MQLSLDFEKLNSYVNKFKGKKVAVIGDIALDHYTFGEIRRLNPERKGIALLNAIKDEFKPGCAGNVAYNLSNLGAEVFLFGLIGDDAFAKVLEEEYQKRSIKLITMNEGETMIKHRLIGNEFSHYYIRLDRGEEKLTPISEKAANFLIEKLKSEKFDCYLLSDYNKRIFTGNFSRQVIELAKERGIKVFSAPKPENIIKFKDSELICLNLKEASEATGYKGYENRREAVKRLKDIAGSKYIVVTCGEHGMVSFDGEYHEMPTRARALIDVTGAGDTVVSTLALSLISGASIIDSSQIANFAAGIVVEKQGTSVTNIEELTKIIEQEFYFSLNK